MNNRQEKHFAERRLSEAERKRLKLMARLYRFFSVVLMALFPVIFIFCIAISSGIPERLPYMPLIVGGVIGIPTLIVVGILVSWERSRDLYHDSLYGKVEQRIAGAVLVERLPNSQLFRSANGKPGSWQVQIEHSYNSRYVWPDMLPGTRRKMTAAERQEICWHLVREWLIFALMLGAGYGCLKAVEYLLTFRGVGGLLHFVILTAGTTILLFTWGLFIFALGKAMELWENCRLTRDLMRGLVCRYYNMVSGKEVEILPYSGRPWTIDDEPFIWRREGRWRQF